MSVTPPADALPQQPYARYGAYFLNGDLSAIQRNAGSAMTCRDDSNVIENREKWRTRGCCGSAYFIGGGKAGSTTMAMLLKFSPRDGYAHHDPLSPFVHAGKEACWAMFGSASSSESYFSRFADCDRRRDGSVCVQREAEGAPPLVALDACPRYTTALHAERIACVHPDTRFIMLVREPVSRVVSHSNDQRLRGGKRMSVDAAMQTVLRSSHGQGARSLEWRLSDYADTLVNFLRFFDPEQILVVHSAALSQDTPDLQRLMDVVCDHLGVAHRQVETIFSNDHMHKRKDEYLRPNANVTAVLHRAFHPSVRRLYTMLGTDLGWEGY
jgi:major membrane immunogen (membrane-anchored lipoprotein)